MRSHRHRAPPRGFTRALRDGISEPVHFLLGFACAPRLYARLLGLPDRTCPRAASADHRARARTACTRSALMWALAAGLALCLAVRPAAAQPAASSPAVQPDVALVAWVSLFTSLLVSAGGGIVLAAGVDDINTVENFPDGRAWAEVADRADRGPTLTGIGWAVMLTGAAGLITSALLLATFAADGTWLRVEVTPGSLALRARF